MKEKKIRCLRCGRVLKDQKAISLGYGSTCYRKIMTKDEDNIPLFDVRELQLREGLRHANN